MLTVLSTDSTRGGHAVLVNSLCTLWSWGARGKSRHTERKAAHTHEAHSEHKSIRTHKAKAHTKKHDKTKSVKHKNQQCDIISEICLPLSLVDLPVFECVRVIAVVAFCHCCQQDVVFLAHGRNIRAVICLSEKDFCTSMSPHSCIMGYQERVLFLI